MKVLKLTALITLAIGAQHVIAMMRPAEQNYCYDMIQTIKNSDTYDLPSLFRIFGIQNNDQDILENRHRVIFIQDKIQYSDDVDQAKKDAITRFKDMINQRANAYLKKMNFGKDYTKEYHLTSFQKRINSGADEHAYSNYLPIVASPAIDIETKNACIERLKAASTRDVMVSSNDLMQTFFDTNTTRGADFNEVVYRKRKAINEILDAVRLNPK